MPELRWGCQVRWLCTLADEGKEPYWSGALALSEFARSIGWGCAVVSSCKGDRPWQAKRFSVRAGFEKEPERLFFCDSDIILHKPDLLAFVLNKEESRRGVWAQYPIALVDYWRHQEMRHADVQVGPEMCARIRALYRELCREHGAGDEAFHFSDWFVGYAIPPATGLRMCDIWDRIAERLLAEGLSWSDGVSIGIAAKACGIPIVYNLRNRHLLHALTHIRNGQKHGYFAGPGECLP